MGADADAKIIYGLPFHGERFDFDEDDYGQDPDTWLATHQGMPEPEGDYDSNPEPYSAYWRAREKLPLNFAFGGNQMSGERQLLVDIVEKQKSPLVILSLHRLNGTLSSNRFVKKQVFPVNLIGILS